MKFLKKNYDSDIDDLPLNQALVNTIDFNICTTNYLGSLQNFQLWFVQNKKYKSGLLINNLEEIWQLCLNYKNIENIFIENEELLFESCYSEEVTNIFNDVILNHWWFLFIYEILNESSTEDLNIFFTDKLFDVKFKYLDLNLLLFSLKTK